MTLHVWTKPAVHAAREWNPPNVVHRSTSWSLSLFLHQVWGWWGTSTFAEPRAHEVAG